MIDKISGELKGRLKGKVVILGMGNTLRADDGVGSILSQRLKGKVAAEVIDGQTVPENFLNRIVKENIDSVLIIDAVDFKDEPGRWRLFNPSQLASSNFFSTHHCPPSLLIEFLRENDSLKAKADVMLLAVQPKSLKLNGKLSSEVEASLNRLERLLIGILK